MTETPKNSKLQHIQVLRAIAVIGIVFFHSQRMPRSFGYLGVDIFFVISGYVISPHFLPMINSNNFYERVRLTLTFLQRRYLRLAPALAVSLSVSSIMLFLLLNIDDHARTWKQAIASLLALGNFGAYKFSGDYFSPSPNAFIHTWSLAVEEQIYILIPILLIVIHARRKALYSFFLSILFLSSVTLFLSGEISDSINHFLGFNYASELGLDFYSPFHRFWEFSLGSFFWLISLRRRNLHPKKHMWILPLLLVAAISVPNFPLEPKITSLAICFLSGIFLVFGGGRVKQNNLTKILALIGDKSYSIYLVHMPICVLVLGSSFTKKLSGLSQGGVILVLTLLSSNLLVKVENRFRSGNRHFKPARNRKIFFAFTVIPLGYFFSLLVGSNNAYFGLDQNPKIQIAAWSLDSSCDRDNSPFPCAQMPNLPLKSMLIGDSTSAALSEVVKKASTENNLQTLIWSRGGCQFIILKSVNLGKPCTRHNLDVVAFVKTTKPAVTFVSNLVEYPSQIHGMARTISLIAPYTKVIVVGQVPVFPDPGKYQKRNLIFSKPYRAPRIYSINRMEKPFLKSNELLMEEFKKLGVTYINLWDVFCDHKSCSRYKNGWLYFDNSHLNVAGAELLHDIFTHEIKMSLFDTKHST